MFEDLDILGPEVKDLVGTNPKIGRAIVRLGDMKKEKRVDYMLPIIADGEAGFGGPLNVFELAKKFIKAGAAGVHFEDQLASEEKCGHMGGYVEKIDGISYGSYIVPGLLMLTLLTQSISNTSFGIFFPKFNGTIYELAEKYKKEGMTAYSRIQQQEFAREKDGYTSVKHQREVGTSYFDAVSNTISSGQSSTTAMAGSTESEQF